MKFKKYLVGTAILTFAIPFMSSSCDTKQVEMDDGNSKYDDKMDDSEDVTVNLLNKKLDFNAFYNEMKDSAENEYPTVFISRNASQFFISSFIQLVGQLELIKKDPNKKYNDIIYLLDSTVNNYDKTLKNEKQRFNFKELLDKYGDSAIKKEDGSFNIEDGELMVLDNPKYLDSSIDKDYEIFPRSLEEMKAYLKPYLDKNVNLFDFYIPDISLVGMSKQLRNWILEHSNKIIILSDGNAQPYKFIRDNYFKWSYNQNKIFAKKFLEKNWSNRLKGSNDYEDIDYHFYYPLKNRIKIFNVDGNYIQYVNKQFDKRGDDWAKIEINSYPLNFENVPKAINVDQKTFIKEYKDLSNLSDRKFTDFIINGVNNYDSKKKNLIFIGSSLFRKTPEGSWRIKTDDISRQEINEYFAKMRELYPESEYNYFYKLHPVYKGADALEYVKYISDNHEDKAIILDPSVSWENMLVLDYSNLENNTSVLFDKNDFKNNSTKSKIFGIQPTTTVLLTTLLFLQQTFDVDLKTAEQFADPLNFPLSEKFNIIKRDIHYTNKNDSYKANIKSMEEVYQYFIGVNRFPKLSEFQTMSDFLKTKSKK